MKAIDLQNGFRRAIQSIQQPAIHHPTRCAHAPVARFHASLVVRSLSTSRVRRAEDAPPSATKPITADPLSLELDANDNASATGPVEDAPAFTAAPELDLDLDAVIEPVSSVDSSGEAALRDANSLGATAARQTQALSSSSSSLSSSQKPAAAPRNQRHKFPRGSHLRVVPASPSYFTSRPNFTDHYLEISALYRKHQLLPKSTHSDTKTTWLSLPEYKAFIGDEPVETGRFRELIKMCMRLNTINRHLMPDEVHTALQRFTKQEEAVVKFMKKSYVDPVGRAYGLGRRKAATARAWIVRGEGNVLINGKSISQYFTRIHQRESALYSLAVTDRMGDYNVFGIVEGGGNTGQAEALTLAVAKALLVHEPVLKKRLKTAGCLTRDRRKVERKKPGHLKARKKPAWVKR